MSDGGLDLNAMSDEEKQEEVEPQQDQESKETTEETSNDASAEQKSDETPENAEESKSEEKTEEAKPQETEPAKEADIFEEEEETEQAGLDLGEIAEPVKTGEWIKISNLMRPFTPMGLRKKITDLGGNIADPKTDFWLNSIKSMAFIKLTNQAEAYPKIFSEMNGKTWPDSNQKQLALSLVSQQQKDADVQADLAPFMPKPVPPPVTDHKAAYEKTLRERSRSPVKRRSRSPSPRKSSPRRMNTDELDKKFRKTTTTPHIYWKPKNEITSAE